MSYLIVFVFVALCRRFNHFLGLRIFGFMQDETVLIWYSGREEKKLWLNTVSRIIPGQRTVSTLPSLSGIPFAESSLNFQSYCWFLQFLDYCGDLACRLLRMAHMSFLATGYFSALPAARQGVSVIFSDSGQ
jgi:hypothetical protein